MPDRILIVEDDAVFGGLLKRAFGRQGYEVTVVTEAAQVDAMLKQSFAFVVLDLKLGNDSGLRLIEPLRAALPNAVILLLSGYVSIATTVDAIKRGADNVLQKPATPEEISAALHGDRPGAVEVAPSPRRLEWEHIQRVLHDHDGNVSAAARALGMHRRTLQRKLQKRPVGR